MSTPIADSSHIRSVPTAELRELAVGKLSFPPGFWEGPGADLDSGDITFLGAFLGSRMMGYIGVRDVASNVITRETMVGIRGLLADCRANGAISTQSLAAIETGQTGTGDIVARNIAFALVGYRNQGIGTKLTRVAMDLAARNASAETPVPVYVSVAKSNPSVGLFARLGFRALKNDQGKVITRTHPYYLPPSKNGEFGLPTIQQHVMMGIVLIDAAAS